MRGPKGLKSRDVKFSVTSTKLKLSVGGKVVLDGELYAKVIADDATFAIEDEGDGRLLTVTIVKMEGTCANGHWKTVVKGEPEIDTNKFGPQVRTFDPNDAAGMARMFD